METMTRNGHHADTGEVLNQAGVGYLSIPAIGGDGRTLAIALTDALGQPTARAFEIGWSELRALFEKRKIVVAGKDGKQADGPMWSPVSIPDGERITNGSVVALSCLVFDFDKVGWEEGKRYLEPYVYIAHTTFSHTPEQTSVRAIIPLTRDVPVNEWKAFYRGAMVQLGGGIPDAKCLNPGRRFFLPACPAERLPDAWTRVHEGRWLDPVEIEPLAPPSTPRVLNTSGLKVTWEPSSEDQRQRDLRHYALAALKSETEKLLSQPEGGRNNALNTAAFCLGQCVGSGWLTEDEAATALAGAADAVGLDGAEFERTFQNGLVAGIREPRPVPDLRWWSERGAECGLKARLREPEPAPGDEPIADAESIEMNLSDHGPDIPVPTRPGSELTVHDLDALGLFRGNPNDYKLGVAWAYENVGRWAFFEGSQWWTYEHGIWRLRDEDFATQSMQEFLERIYAQNRELNITPAKLGNSLKIARNREKIGIHLHSKLNARKGWVALENKVLDIEKGTSLEHSPNNWLTSKRPVTYDPDATCPTWDRFLRQVLITEKKEPCQEWIDFLQEWVGYLLIPDNSAQLSMFWVGGGENGKTVVTSVIENLIGADYCCDVPIEMLHEPYHRAELQGKLVGFVDEPDAKAMQKNAGHFKKITGGGVMSARRVNERVFNFKPLTRLIITCNELPKTSDLSHGYFRRIAVIDWRFRVTEATRNNRLIEELSKELPGILNWALEGLGRLKDRNWSVMVPEESKRLLSDYQLSQDLLSQFIEDRCGRLEGALTKFDPLYRAFRQYCEESGEKPWSKQAVGRRLTQLGYVSEMIERGESKQRGRRGLVFPVQRRDEEPPPPGFED